jgi:hypothetical protein
MSLGQLSGESLGARLQGLQSLLGVRQKAGGALVGGHELIQGRRAVGQLRDRLLEPREGFLEAGTGLLLWAQTTLAATRPRIPLTKRPASSPEKVFASSIDSLMAALVGTCLSIVIS